MFWHDLKDKDEDVLFLYDDFQPDSTFNLLSFFSKSGHFAAKVIQSSI